MSGVAGIFNLDGAPVNLAILERMGYALRHRGPHGAGYWHDGAVALAHWKLATTPESVSEKQPLSNETGNCCITFDGRVDNREELEAALRASGAVLRTVSDTELVLRAYEKWDEECPSKIIGDFAFVIWDGRKRQLLCARDVLGIRPIFYYKDSRRFLFASEMQPLFEHPEVNREPDFLLLGKYLSDSFRDQEHTRYANVLRIPPCHILIVKPDGGISKKQYWDIDPGRTIRYGTDEGYAEHFLSLFTESVRCRLRSAGPVGAKLSGGLDSSSIVCVAQNLLRNNVVDNPGFESFSKVFEGLRCDERSYIQDVVKQSGVKENFFTYDPSKASANLEQAAAYPDVLYHPAVLISVALNQSMQSRGIHVVLDGTGGDEVLNSGFHHLTDLVAEGRLLAAFKQARSDSRTAQVQLRKLIFPYCVFPFVPESWKPVLRPIHRLIWKNWYHGCVNPEFLRQVGIKGRPIRKKEQRLPTRSQQELYNSLFIGWNAIVAQESQDLFSSRFSLEFRYPFFDRRIVEFMLAIPPKIYWNRGQTKLILRNSMKGILPESVRTRQGKAEFSPVLHAEMVRAPSQVSAIEDIFRTSEMAKYGILNREKVVELYERYRRSESVYLAGDVAFLLGLELWFRSLADESKKVGFDARQQQA